MTSFIIIIINKAIE